MLSEPAELEAHELLPQEKDGVKRKLWCGDLRVILNYMMAEQERKKSGVHIGIFTVFMVVCVITMLKAVV